MGKHQNAGFWSWKILSEWIGGAPYHPFIDGISIQKNPAGHPHVWNYHVLSLKQMGLSIHGWSISWKFPSKMDDWGYLYDSGNHPETDWNSLTWGANFLNPLDDHLRICTWILRRQTYVNLCINKTMDGKTKLRAIEHEQQLNWMYSIIMFSHYFQLLNYMDLI